MNHYTRWIKLLLLAILPFAFPRSTVADGKVFRAAAVAPPVTTPDQRALLHFAGNVERLVIETSAHGAGTNFAWVIPFPSEPKVEPVSTNFFRNLDRAFQPKIIFQTFAGGN